MKPYMEASMFRFVLGEQLREDLALATGLDHVCMNEDAYLKILEQIEWIDPCNAAIAAMAHTACLAVALAFDPGKAEQAYGSDNGLMLRVVKGIRLGAWLIKKCEGRVRELLDGKTPDGPNESLMLELLASRANIPEVMEDVERIVKAFSVGLEDLTLRQALGVSAQILAESVEMIAGIMSGKVSPDEMRELRPRRKARRRALSHKHR